MGLPAVWVVDSIITQREAGVANGTPFDTLTTAPGGSAGGRLLYVTKRS